jgi:hypothetical protein
MEHPLQCQVVTSLILLVCKNVEIQKKLALDVSAHEIN